MLKAGRRDSGDSSSVHAQGRKESSAVSQPFTKGMFGNLNKRSWSLSLKATPKEEGALFLEENKLKEGVITLPSGLQYKVLKAGTGVGHPLPATPCDCHYEGKLINGNKFDSSYDRGAPTTFAPNQVIAGWTEAMQLMVEGDEWEMYIPSNLAYGDQGVGGGLIPGGATLIFRMELLSIKGPSRPKA